MLGQPYRDPRSRSNDWLVRTGIGRTKRFRGLHAEREARAWHASETERAADHEDQPPGGVTEGNTPVTPAKHCTDNPKGT